MIPLEASRLTPPVRPLALLVAFTLVVLAMNGCAHGVSAAYQTLDNTSATLGASVQAFEQFDHDHQMVIVTEGKKAGKLAAEIELDLQDYRQKRSAITKAFADAGAVVLTGRALLPLVENGIKKQTDLNSWLQLLLNAAVNVQAALKLVGILE